MSFGSNPTTTTQGSLATNQFPISTVAVPDTASGNLTALKGGPAATDTNGNSLAAAAMYVYDGNDVAQGATTDSANANTVVGQLKQIKTNTASVVVGSLPALPAGTNLIGNVELVDGAGTNKAAISSGGALKVDNSAVTQPVSGTISDQHSNNTADYDTGAGTQTMTMYGVALPASGGSVAGGTSTNPIRTDPTGTTTQPISASSLPLPTGAALEAGNLATLAGAVTSAKVQSNTAQINGVAPTMGNGTSGTGVQRVTIASDSTGQITANAGTNLNTSALALDTSVNGVIVSQGSTTSGEKGPLIQGAVTTAAPSYTTAQTSPISLTTAGAVRTDASGTTQPVSGTVSAAQSGIWTVQPGNTANTIAWKVDGSAVTQPVSGTVALSGTIPENLTQIGGNSVVTGGANGLLAVGGPVASGGANADNPVKAGAVFNTTQPTVTNGQVVDVQATARGAQIVATGTDTFNATINAALPAGSNVIGHVIADSGSTTAATQATASNLNAQVVGSVASAGSNAGNPVKVGGAFNTTQPTVTNSQIVDAQMTARGAQIVATGADTFNVTAAAGTNLNTSALALESGGNLATLAGAVTSAKVQTNVAQINGVTPLMGNGVTGTGSQRVTIASDNTAFSVNAAQSGTWTVQPGNTANTIAWKVDGSAVTQPVSATNLQTNLNQIAGSAISTAASGVQKVGVVGNAGATVDSTVGAGTAPTNAFVMGAVYNSSAPAPTTGQSMALQVDQAGNTRIVPGIALATLSAWNSGTSLNATQTIFTNSGVEAVLVQLTQTTTLSAGAITFEVTYDGSTFLTIPASSVLDPTSTTFAQISIPYTVQASTNKQFLLNMNGAQALRIKLSTQITGSGAVTPNYALLPFSPADGVIAYSPTAANFNTTTNVAQINGVAVTMGNGVSGTGVQRVTIASDSTGTVAATQSGTWTIQPGNTANTTPWLVNAGCGAAVALYGSNPATTGVATDAQVKFGASGLTAVNHVMIANNTTINVNYELDASTTVGSDIVAPGQKIFLDVFGTLIVHLQAASSQNINGSSAGNVVVRGWL